MVGLSFTLCSASLLSPLTSLQDKIVVQITPAKLHKQIEKLKRKDVNAVIPFQNVTFAPT